MGSGSWSSDEWKSYATSSSYDTKSTSAIFSKRELDKDLDPKGVKFRECRDSADNPLSTAVMIGLDVTGSMSPVLDYMARTGLPELCKAIYDRKPISNPGIMCAAIGDAEAGDEAPLQVTQFESDIRIAQQLERLYLENRGGGNQFESYSLPWYFAANHTSIDCFEKRGKKGYLFTMGDEYPNPVLRAEDIERVLGYRPQADLSIQDVLTLASRQWEVFHLVVLEGHHALHHKDTMSRWSDVLGQRAIPLADRTKMAETIVSIIQVAEGADHAAVASSWDGKTSLIVSEAIKNVQKGTNAGSASALVTL